MAHTGKQHLIDPHALFVCAALTFQNIFKDTKTLGCPVQNKEQCLICVSIYFFETTLKQVLQSQIFHIFIILPYSYVLHDCYLQ